MWKIASDDAGPFHHVGNGGHWREGSDWGMKKSVNWAPMPGHIPYVLDFRAGSISLADS